MSAEPAPAHPHHLNEGTDAAVYTLDRHRTPRTARHTAQGRWTTMHNPSPGSPSNTDGQATDQTHIIRSPEEGIADYAEAWMNAREHSLTVPITVAVYTATLGLAGQTLNGAVAQGIISEEQRAKLADLLNALEQAPGYL